MLERVWGTPQDKCTRYLLGLLVVISSVVTDSPETFLDRVGRLASTSIFVAIESILMRRCLNCFVKLPRVRLDTTGCLILLDGYLAGGEVHLPLLGVLAHS